MRMNFIFALLLALSSCVNSYMFYFNPEYLNWTEAQTYCRKHYTDLATTDDQADSDELLKTVPKGFTQGIWIGLYRTSKTAPWVWSDRSTSTLRLWASGQPNNYGGQQFCVGTYLTGQWNDLECPIQYASVCYSEERESYRFETIGEEDKYGETGGQSRSECERSCSDDRDSAADREGTEGEWDGTRCKAFMENANK